MKRLFKSPLILIIFGLLLNGCKPAQIEAPKSEATPPEASAALAAAVPITLPVLDALLADERFKANLKSELQLTDEQIAALRKISSAEVANLRHSNAETRPGDAEAARQHAVESIRGVIGADKSEQLLALARARWNKGSEELATAAAKEAEPTMLEGPNAVPKDTRIVVNIPAFRMDVFSNGALLKSYKVGIGYPQFPLPQGLRKAQQIIFNPTWTPPDEPWVASMKGVAVGQSVAAGSKLNPLGPIKIPIGAPSLIHGGKPLAKIGTFASHGCVGMTNSQVRDFATVLAKASETELSDETMASYLKRRNKTQVVQLTRLVPVELRYETIVFEDGQLHIYRDVYDQNTNTEENLRAVFKANGASLDDLTSEERDQVLDALNAMSRFPKKHPAKPTSEPGPSPGRSAVNANQNKPEAPPPPRAVRNQKEIVIDVPTLVGKGYPAPVNLDSGAGMQLSAAATPVSIKP
jgi:lipoprotein-anchoring transpeptidase ErfK/SrfK